MTDKVYNVLFICTHNSARSIIAEGLLNQMGAPRLRAFSAGSQPARALQPLALQVLAERHVPTDGFRSKDWQEFAVSGAPPLDFVFTVCDKAAGEVCPVWSGQPMTARCGVPDPAVATGDADKRLRAYEDTLITLKRRVELMLALPLASLDRLSLQRQLREIGTH